MAVLVDNLENNVIENVKASDHVTIIERVIFSG